MRPLFLFPAPGRICRESRHSSAGFTLSADSRTLSGVMPESRKFFQGAGLIISVMSPARSRMPLYPGVPVFPEGNGLSGGLCVQGDPMKNLLSAFAAFLSAFMIPGCLAGNIDDKLSGTWICTSPQRGGKPALELEFPGNGQITLKNLLEEPVTIKYEIPERPYMQQPEPGSFSISFRHYYQMRSLGVLLNTSFSQELYYHVENGVPILSETGFEHDGCGFMIAAEYLPESHYQAGFVSKLYRDINGDCPEQVPRGR